MKSGDTEPPCPVYPVAQVGSMNLFLVLRGPSGSSTLVTPTLRSGTVSSSVSGTTAAPWRRCCPG